MSHYLKRLDIANVGNVEEEKQSHYLKRVNIVEVVDQDGNPWEPVPGPDPWDELVVATATRWSNLNNYSPEVAVFGFAASFIGGSDQVTTQYRWQYQLASDPGVWISSNDGWVTYTNGSVEELDFVIPGVAAGGKVRLQSRARDASTDPVTSVMSNASAQDVGYYPLVVSATTVSGLPYTGQTVTCTPPAVTGGDGNYSYSYMWLDENGTREQSPLSSLNTTVLGPYDLGQIVNCYVTVTSGDSQSANTQTTNGVGPVLAAPVMSPVVTKLNDDVVNMNDAHEVPPGTHTLQVVPNETPNDIQFFWSLRSGAGTLVQDPILPDIARYTTGEGDFGPSIACTLESNIAADDAAGSFQLIVI